MFALSNFLIFGIDDALAVAIISLIGTATNAAINAHNVRKSNESNAQNTADVNASNQSIAADANQNQLALLDRQNAYNDPSASAARLERAGLNRNYAVADAGGQTSSGNVYSIANQQAPAAVPFQMQSNPILEALQASGQDATRRLTDAQANRQLIENEVLPALLQQNVELNNVSISYQKANTNLTRIQMRQIAKQCVALDEELNNLKLQGKQIAATTSNIEESTLASMVNRAMQAKQFDLTKRQVESQLGVDAKQLEMLSLQVAQFGEIKDAEVRLKVAEADNAEVNLKIQNNKLLLDTDNAEIVHKLIGKQNDPISKLVALPFQFAELITHYGGNMFNMAK